MTQLLLDEMLAPAVARQLRNAGGDAIAVSERADVRILERSWLAPGRLHSGLVYIKSKAYPMNRGRMGSIAAALLARHHAITRPQPGTSDWL